MKITDINKEIEKLENRTAFLKNIRAIYEEFSHEELGEYPGAALRAYVLTGSVTDAAKVLNESGLRNGNKKYASGDISRAIESVTQGNEIVRGGTLIQQLFHEGQQKAKKWYN